MTAHRNYDPPPLNLAVLLSGSGRTLDNLLERIAAQKLYAKVNLVISSREDVRGVVLAQKAGLRTIVSSPKGRDRSAWSCDIFNLCRDAGANIVVLAGFLHLLEIPSEFESRVLNIHPSLLPAFGGKGLWGMHVHRAVIESGARVSGCTVHLVDHQYDHGPILYQKVVAVLDDDTPESLAARVFAVECEALPKVLQVAALCGIESLLKTKSVIGSTTDSSQEF